MNYNDIATKENPVCHCYECGVMTLWDKWPGCMHIPENKETNLMLIKDLKDFSFLKEPSFWEEIKKLPLTKDKKIVIPHLTHIYHPDELNNENKPVPLIINSSNVYWASRGFATMAGSRLVSECYSTPEKALEEIKLREKNSKPLFSSKDIEEARNKYGCWPGNHYPGVDEFGGSDY